MSGSMGLSAASPHSFSSNNGLNNNVNTLTNNCHSSVSTLMDPLQQEVQQQQTSLTNPNSRFSLEIPQMSIHHNQLNNNPHHHINNNANIFNLDANHNDLNINLISRSYI